MYYNFYYKLILINYFNNFNKSLIYYFSGKYNENEFKIFRLHYGIYRQKNSYMCRIALPGGLLNYFQFVIFSYISFFYDKKYFHFTTRTNIQFNWLKIFYMFELFKKFSLFFISSVQTSGNCVRNITSSLFNNLYDNPWIEILKQWFNKNFEFLFLPRKFKISLNFSKVDDNLSKSNDMSFYIKKNNLNNIIINIIVGGGMGRTPTLGFYLLKNFHWKNIINYSDKILRIYNIYGFRNNIYKSRLKILFKFLNISKFLNFINKEFNFSNNLIYILNEKEINYFFTKIDIYNYNNYNYDNLKINKNILFNFFFLNWLKFNFKKNIIYLCLKNFNKPSGDLNYLQVKILYFFFLEFNFLKIFNRQNLIILNFYNLYLVFKKLKKYFFNIFNSNLITDTISCPGSDYCVLANSKSIIISKLIQNIFIDFNSVLKLNLFFLNISGCINSCGHHHVSNIGLVGVNKNNLDHYQIYIGGNFNNFNSLNYSKVLTSSFIYFKISYYLIKIVKFFLKINRNNNFKFIEIFDFYNFKKNIV